MEFKFSESLTNVILGYLSSRPANEVFKILTSIDQELKAQGNGGLTITLTGRTIPQQPVQQEPTISETPVATPDSTVPVVTPEVVDHVETPQTVV